MYTSVLVPVELSNHPAEAFLHGKQDTAVAVLHTPMLLGHNNSFTIDKHSDHDPLAMHGCMQQ